MRRKQLPMCDAAHLGEMAPQAKHTRQKIRSAASAFEEMDYNSLRVNEHLYNTQSLAIQMLDLWAIASGVIAVTETHRIGTLVLPAVVSSSYRN